MKWRIWLLSLGISLVGILIFAIASTRVYYNSAVDDAKASLRVYMNTYDAKFTRDREGAIAFSKMLGGARITFMDGEGNVLADSAAQSVTENHSNRAEVQAALNGGEGFAVRDSATLGKNMIYYCKSVADGFLVRIAVFVDSDRTVFVRMLPTFSVFAVIMLALCVIVAFVATHFIISPVKRLASQAAQNGEVSSKYPELKPVADILNERNRDIGMQLQQIQAERDSAEHARQSKDEFISNVTHEMNTPLTSIHGYAELLALGGMSKAQQQTAYKTIMAQSERLTNLVTCIVNYSKIDSDDQPIYEVDLSSLAKETLHALKPEADKRNIEMIDKIDDGVVVMSRHERLSEILGNLIRNAIKYNKDNGKITVTLNAKELVVEDTGIGISEENLDKVFSRFFTVDKSHGGKNGGFGLGLAVAKKICAKSGWQIGVESKLDKGSKFTVKF